MEDLDITRVGRMIGTGEDEVHAVLDVEAAGEGFDSKGRPKMLFEPHLFYRELKNQPKKLSEAMSLGLAYDGWRPGSYPPDSYPRLLAAMKIDETAALKSASWGLPQILGSNHKAAGYPTVQKMVEDFTQSEGVQLEAMIRFVKAKGLDIHLRNHDWASFARGYNGALYAAHGYHLKMRAAFERWQKIKDTPVPKDFAPVPDVKAPKPKPRPGKVAAGAGAGAVVAGGGAVIATQSSANGASTGQIFAVVCITLVIAAVVAFFVIRWRKS